MCAGSVRIETGSYGSVVARGAAPCSPFRHALKDEKAARETVVMNEEVPEQAGAEEEAEVRTNVQ